MNHFPLSGNNDEDDNNCEKFNDESIDETTSSLFIHESWLKYHYKKKICPFPPHAL
jgi:hypothetical protein